MLGTRRAARLLVALIVGPAVFATAAPVSAEPFPEVIQLPEGWLPEGIASGPGTTVYSGSRATGDILAVSVLDGDQEIVVDAPDGRTAIGIEQDRYGRFGWPAARPATCSSTTRTAGSWRSTTSPTQLTGPPSSTTWW